MTEVDARRALVDIAAQWACGLVNADEVVDTAAEALVAGVDSISLVLLAGTPRAQADVEVPDLLPQAMEELHLSYFGWDQQGSWIIAAAALAREHLRGGLTAPGLCRIIHQRFGHDAHEFIEPIAVLDDRFDTLNYFGDESWDELVAATHDAAARLVRFVGQFTASEQSEPG